MQPQYDASNLVIHPGNSHEQDVIVEVTPELAGWDYIHFQARQLGAGGAPEQTPPPQLITPADAAVEIRGGDNATRQINSIIPPGFDCQRLVVVEVYTPGGSWSSYPPHKHDIHKTDASGTVLEADLDEIYYYK